MTRRPAGNAGSQQPGREGHAARVGLHPNLPLDLAGALAPKLTLDPSRDPAMRARLQLDGQADLEPGVLPDAAQRDALRGVRLQHPLQQVHAVRADPQRRRHADEGPRQPLRAATTVRILLRTSIEVSMLCYAMLCYAMLCAMPLQAARPHSLLLLSIQQLWWIMLVDSG